MWLVILLVSPKQSKRSSVQTCSTKPPLQFSRAFIQIVAADAISNVFGNLEITLFIIGNLTSKQSVLHSVNLGV